MQIPQSWLLRWTFARLIQGPQALNSGFSKQELWSDFQQCLVPTAAGNNRQLLALPWKTLLIIFIVLYYMIQLQKIAVVLYYKIQLHQM